MNNLSIVYLFLKKTTEELYSFMFIICVKIMTLQIENSWKEILKSEFEQKYFSEIKDFLVQEIEAWKTIYPHPKNIFSAFNHTPIGNLKVVILGQDPYHGPHQAHWLSFSVEKWIKIPPSLKNIYKEIQNEYPDFTIPEHGNLISWANQGILLLNSILTVEASKPASHSKIGWEQFTDAVIKSISDNCEGIIFLLWGNFSRWKKSLINEEKHFILESPHPSPFSAHSWFFGNGHFRTTNELLRSQNKSEIDWNV